jgi:hypothetical protein
VGLLCWGYLLYKAKEMQFDNWNGYLWWTIPRISFALAIEILAGFFFRLHTKTSNDKKYYNNEITNLESKLISIAILQSKALESKEREIVISALINDDRNATSKETNFSQEDLGEVEIIQKFMSTLSSKKEE